MKDFKKYAEQAREEFAYEVGKYTVENNLALRTKADSLLIAFDQAVAKALLIDSVINWVACKDTKPIDGKEYLISDGEDVTEAQWYDDSKWGGEPYDSYTHYAEKPKPPCL